MIVSRARPNDILVKSETTWKDTIHSLGAMLMCLRHSRNSNELEKLCSESVTMGFRLVNIHFDKLYVGEPTSDTIILRVSRFVNFRRPYARAIEVSFGDNLLKKATHKQFLKLSQFTGQLKDYTNFYSTSNSRL